MRYDDLDIFQRKFVQNKVKEAERDENLKEESKKDENGVGKLEDIEAYLTPWTRNSRKKPNKSIENTTRFKIPVWPYEDLDAGEEE